MYNLQQLIFYIFAGLTIFSAFLVITQNNPVRCVLFLVLAFLSSAVLWLMVQAEFLALILVLVYVGAVMTLFLFVVMMLNIDVESMKKEMIKRLPGGLILVAIFVTLLYMAIPHEAYQAAVEVLPRASQASPIHATPAVSNTEQIGLVLYTNYFLAFELAAAILLVAIIGAITLTHRKPRGSKQQDVVKQLMTDRKHRVRLVSMKAEK